MGRIFYLMGKSSTGKDSIYGQLSEDAGLGLKKIVLYTTRPIRAGETDGVEYFFVDDKTMSELEAAGKIIEKRAYHTVHGVWSYFTVCDEQIDLKNNDYLVIGTLESYVNMKKYFVENALVPVYIEVDDGVRLQRALDRERAQEQPKYRELCRRYLADSDDFSEENIQAAGITKRFINDDFNVCLGKIKEYIKSFQ